ncbi:hypothetical protein [Halorhabdus salina]|uniref:hypothetical protein n=1 Tax=Halorhabdus salina TaxID=2750670 RepID=UPI0015EE5362|nr:hypothetical protein [Halorhabdus salina]
MRSVILAAESSNPVKQVVAWLIEMANQLVTNWHTTRSIVAFVAIAIIAYWTLERFGGEGDDPTIRSTSSSDTGTMSFLISGIWAVAFVAGIAALAMFPEIRSGNPVVIGLIVVPLVIHWIFEKEEREDV